MRILVAGILGGIAMFVWATIAHVATPLATIGLSPMPDEAAATAALRTSLGDRQGLFVFPFMHGSAGDSKAVAAQATRMKTEPHGLLAYNPTSESGPTADQLIVEFALEVVESLLTAVVLASITAAFAPRLGLATLIGVIAGMATNLSYWNWYGFSLEYSLANAFTELMKFVFAGAAIAAVLGWRGRRAR